MICKDKMTYEEGFQKLLLEEDSAREVEMCFAFYFFFYFGILLYYMFFFLKKFCDDVLFCRTILRHYGSKEKSEKLVFEGVVTFVLSFLVIQFSSQQSKA